MSSSNKDDGRRKRLQCIIKQNHLIISNGCGSKKCRSDQCVSSGKREPLDQDSAFKVAIEMSSKTKDFYPTVLNSHLIFSLVNHSSGPLKELLNPALKTVISDPDLLCKSFNQSNTSGSSELVTIDKDELEEAYECLFALDNPELDELICESFEELACNLQQLIAERPKEVKLLINCFIIFLLNPNLQNPEYAQGCFAEFCGCLAVLRNSFKLNIIHYISTLPSDTITKLIYNFQQVIAIGIALREDDSTSLNQTKAVSDGVICLQLLYGAVVYRAQHTIHHVLGDLSITKQLSRELQTPVALYTNAFIQVISSQSPETIGDDANTVRSNESNETAQNTIDSSTPLAVSDNKALNGSMNSPEVDTDQATSDTHPPNELDIIESSNEQTTANKQATANGHEQTAANGHEQTTENEQSTANGHEEDRSVNQESFTSVDTPTDPPEADTTSEEFMPTDSSEIIPFDDEMTDDLDDNEFIIGSFNRSFSEASDEEHTDSLRSATDLLLPLLALQDELEGLQEIEEQEGNSHSSPPIESARRLLDVDADSDSSEGADDPLTQFFRIRLDGLMRSPRRPPKVTSKLFAKLGIDPLWDSHTSIDLSLFYNENISQELKMDEDYINYKSGKGFSFLRYPFILKPHVKSIGLQFDNRINMSRSINPFFVMISGEYPYLKLVIKRNNIVEDALTHLEMVAEEDPDQLQRQLYVEFDGEEGVDEGGVQKEFFQLIIAELFNPNYGMFVDIEDTRMLWFNPQSFEVDHNYKLIGMLLGLAVYNNVILDIRFPTVLYQKLMGEEPDIRDLIQSHPLLGSSLQQLLDYPDNDVEDVFLLDFVASTADLFGETITHELAEDGANIPVTSDNKHVFVAKYVDYVLNTAISKQFEQFKKGFDMIAARSPLKDWFRPEELEKLIVGSPKLDFKALQSVTRYDNGYTATADVIKWFWEITHAMSDEDKSKLLAFSTGCGRAPVGGMGEMNFIIVKNGGDSERLPTAHTCFNVLLLPEYPSKEKLREKLYNAIQHFEGFGMI